MRKAAEPTSGLDGDARAAAASGAAIPAQRSHPFWRREPALLAVLVLAATLPYLNSLANGFVYDDDVQVLRNPLVRGFSHLKLIFTSSVFSYQGGAQGTTNYYRPVMTFGYLLCHEIFGFKPFGFHLANIILNAAVVCVLYFVTRRLFKDRTLAFLAAALFALHPIHSEAVDWIAAVTDLELALFFLLAFWLFLKLGDAASKKKWLTQAGMIVMAALALLSKEPAAVLPFLATVYEHACREDRALTSLRVKLNRYGALWLVLIAYVAVRTRILGVFAPVSARPEMTSSAVVLSALALTGHYIEKLFWPIHLSAAYLFPASIGTLLPRILAGFAIVAGCALLMIYFWRRERRVFFSFVWFFATLAPVLNPRWLPSFVFAERYLYLPSVGFCWAVCWGGLAITRRFANTRRARRPAGIEGRSWRGIAAAACLCALAGLMAARILVRNKDWKNDLIFYTRTLRAAPRSVVLHNNLGKYYWDHGDLRGAEEQWEAAYRIEPKTFYVLDNLGLLRLTQKRYREAAIYFDQALAATPDDEGALTGLGEADKDMHRDGAAEKELRAAIKLAPLNFRTRVSLGELYFDEKKYGPAEAEFQAAIRSMPTLRAYFGLGLAKWMQGDTAAAERYFKAARQLDPSDSRTEFMLGLLYGATGRSAEAIREYQAGLKLDPGNKTALAALARLQSKPGTAARR